MAETDNPFLDMVHYWNGVSKYSSEEENELYNEMLDRLSVQLDFDIWNEKVVDDGVYRIEYPIFFS